MTRFPVGADPRSGAPPLAVGDELADVLIYLVRLADVLGVDLLDAAGRKLAENAERYPAERARGSAAKAPRSEPPGG